MASQASPHDRHLFSAASLVDLIAKMLSKQLGQQVIVDNKPGTDDDLGMDLMARAPKHGYTISFALPVPLTDQYRR